MITERWKPIPGYVGYQVSDLGKVKSLSRQAINNPRSVPERILKPRLHRSGHLYVVLWNESGPKNFGIHQLVLLAFVGSCPNGMEVRHFPDRDPANNRLINLSYSDKKTNQIDRIMHGTDSRGEKHALAKLSLNDVSDIESALACGVPGAKLARKYGVLKGCIYKIKHGRTWKNRNSSVEASNARTAH